MPLSLTVVTHTDKKFRRDISRCVRSVNEALVDNCTHKIIEFSGDNNEFIRSRHESLQLDDIVVFVDDDDYISPDSLKHCLNALSHTSAGVAFTNEIVVYQTGNQNVNRIDLRYSSLLDNPQSVHHMTAYRRDYITARSLDLSLKYQCSIEWISRVDAACNAGAIYVPINGYFWVQHENQTHRRLEQINYHKIGIPLVSDELRTWNIKDGIIPTWDIKINL